MRPAPAPQSKTFGGMELRPGVETSEGAFASENSLWLGMSFPSMSLSYNQDIDTAASNTEDSGTPIVQDGHVKFKFDNIWTDGRTGFHDELRVYAPTNSAKRDKGMVTAIRNYFKLTHKVSPYATMFFAEVPILHLYSDAGAITPEGAAANPSFENRMIFGFDFAVNDHVTFSIPIHFYTTKYRDFAEGAKLNDEWDPSLFFWPEINWRVNGGPVNLGIAYRSNNLTKVTTEGTSSDFNGVFQGIFGVSF